jgi:uncharacterized protein YozE (UPF0346 family)
VNLEEALKKIAENIWNKGESESIGESCLVPSDFSDNKSEYNLISDFLEKNYDYTHFDRKWSEKGKSVLLNFYSCEEFGATNVKKENLAGTYIVNL